MRTWFSRACVGLHSTHAAATYQLVRIVLFFFFVFINLTVYAVAQFILSLNSTSFVFQFPILGFYHQRTQKHFVKRKINFVSGLKLVQNIHTSHYQFYATATFWRLFQYYRQTNSKINTISSHFKHLHGLDLLSISLLSNFSTDLKDKPKAESKAILNAIQNTPKKLTEYLFKTQ